MVLMIIGKTLWRALIAFHILCLVSYSTLTAQENRTAVADTLVLSLDDMIRLAYDQSPDAILAKHNFLVSYWEYRTYRAERLPSLNLSGTLGNYNRSMVSLQNSETGVVNTLNNNTLSNSLSLYVKQNLTFSGGVLSVTSGLKRLDQYSPYKSVTYTSQPVYVKIEQPINGYNAFKWEKRIEPKRFEFAKRVYIEQMQEITLNAALLFFDLLAAEAKVKASRISIANNEQMYGIAEERFKLGSISKDALLQLELKLLNDKLALNDNMVSVQMALMRVRTFLGLNERVELHLMPPEERFDLILSVQDVLGKVFLNSSEALNNEVKLLQAEKAVAQARANSGLSANISMQFGLNQTAHNFGGVYKSPLDQEVLGLTLSIPIVDWGLRRGKLKVAQSRVKVVESQVEQAVNTIKESVVLKVMQFNAQGSQCDVSRKADEVGRARYEITKERFVNGTVGVTELNTAQSEMDDAAIRYIGDLSKWWQYYYSIQKLTLFNYIKGSAIEADFSEIEGLTLK